MELFADSVITIVESLDLNFPFFECFTSLKCAFVSSFVREVTGFLGYFLLGLSEAGEPPMLLDYRWQLSLSTILFWCFLFCRFGFSALDPGKSAESFEPFSKASLTLALENLDDEGEPNDLVNTSDADW